MDENTKRGPNRPDLSAKGPAPIVDSREKALANRETWIAAREKAALEHEVALIERETIASSQEQALLARRESDGARIDRERLIAQMRDANERLLVSTVRADELAEEAELARTTAARSLVVEAEGRRRAETLAARLRTSEEALRASERRANASNRAKDEFLAMLGHELRNPLAPIVTALELMAMRDPNAFVRERTIIERHAHHLVRLVDDLLDVSRITRGEVSLDRHPVELAELVTRAIASASPLLEKAAHHLTVNVEPRGLVIDVDAQRVVQAITHLVTNAAKYTPAGGSIQITGALRGAIVTLCVRDSGVGISAEMLPQIFEVFSQEHQASDRSLGGLGLGLMMVRSFVAMHEGTVTAASEGVGCGSEFTIELPVSTRPLVTRASRDTGDHVVLAHVSRKILVVEDNKDAAELVAEALAGIGHDVKVAFDGPAALVIAKDFLPEVILLDIGLPVMDGYELATRLRALLEPTELQFIAITGYGQIPDLRRSQDAGFAMHLVKPVSGSNLRRSISKLPASSSAPR